MHLNHYYLRIRGMIINRIWNTEATLMQFQGEIISIMLSIKQNAKQIIESFFICWLFNSTLTKIGKPTKYEKYELLL